MLVFSRSQFSSTDLVSGSPQKNCWLKVAMSRLKLLRSPLLKRNILQGFFLLIFAFKFIPSETASWSLMPAITEQWVIKLGCDVRVTSRMFLVGPLIRVGLRTCCSRSWSLQILSSKEHFAESHAPGLTDDDGQSISGRFKSPPKTMTAVLYFCFILSRESLSWWRFSMSVFGGRWKDPIRSGLWPRMQMWIHNNFGVSF